MTAARAGLPMGLAAVLVCGIQLTAPPALPTASAAQQRHPRLVSPDTTTCGTCHEALFHDRANVHEPARTGCSDCHRIDSGEGGTSITLVEAEPGLCLTCHDDLAGAAGGKLRVPHAPVTESCLTCHDPHASSRPRLLSQPPGELCGACHAAADLTAKHGDQITPATDCTRCHQPHGSGNDHLLRDARLHAPVADGGCSGCHLPPIDGRVRLRARGEKLCTACHGDLADASLAGKTPHAALHGDKGRAGCLSCHDPHMSRQPRLALEPGARLCASCHPEIVQAARAASGHPPAAEDCLTCHVPHASSLPHLLNAPAAELCRGCHDTSDARLIKAHLGAPLASLDCTGCHTPHGSGNAHLLARNLHAALADGCPTCHEGSADRLIENGESSLCLTCHAEIGTLAAGAAVPHPAMEVARCTECHNPHASPQEHLVKRPGGGECLVCHEGQSPGEGETAHGAIESIGCRACHEPHGGSRPNLLRRTGADLCLSCHDPSRREPGATEGSVQLLGRFEVPAARFRAFATLRLSADGQRNHPVPNHLVLGSPTPEEMKRVRTRFEGDMTCLTCHDPHKGRSQLLRWNAASSMEACGHCHAK